MPPAPTYQAMRLEGFNPDVLTAFVKAPTSSNAFFVADHSVSRTRRQTGGSGWLNLPPPAEGRLLARRIRETLLAAQRESSRLRRSMRSECFRYSDRRTESVALSSFSWMQRERRRLRTITRTVIGTANGAARGNSTCVCGWLWCGHRVPR